MGRLKHRKMTHTRSCHRCLGRAWGAHSVLGPRLLFTRERRSPALPIRLLKTAVLTQSPGWVLRTSISYGAPYCWAKDTFWAQSYFLWRERVSCKMYSWHLWATQTLPGCELCKWLLFTTTVNFHHRATPSKLSWDTDSVWGLMAAVFRQSEQDRKEFQ